MKYVSDNDLEAQIRETTSIQQVSIGKSWRDLIPVIKVDISSVSELLSYYIEWKRFSNLLCL